MNSLEIGGLIIFVTLIFSFISVEIKEKRINKMEKELSRGKE